MKNTALKIYLSVVMFFTTFYLVAQGPGNDFEDETGDTSGNVEDEAPINRIVLLLIITAIIFAYYKLKDKKQITH